MRVFLGIAFFLFAVIGQAQSQSDAAKIYAVVFDVAVDSSGKLQALKVIKVIYPSSGTTDAVNVAVPDSFISAAHVLLLKRTYPARPDHRPDHVFTYFFYDPSQPTRADIGPRAEHT
jgi:hypothetical protein